MGMEPRGQGLKDLSERPVGKRRREIMKIKTRVVKRGK